VGVGVKLTSVTDFFKNTTKITRIERFVGTIHGRKAIIQNALSKLGQPYNLLNYNCEHFVNDVLKKKPVSRQVTTAFGIAAIVTLIGIALTNKN